MFLIILTFLSALSISAVAIYYSVAGLMTIFSAAAIPIMIMGGVLETGKLVAAVWLHRYWHESVWWLRTYLSIAVIILMFITSMGIFGFLSRAHIEQTAGATEVSQTIVRFDADILRLEGVIERAEEAIITTQSQSQLQTDNIQEQIDREQERIDSAYARIQPEIDRQIAIIERSETRGEGNLLDQLERIDSNISALENALASNDTRTVQAIVGVRQDGAFGPGTRAAVQEFRTAQDQARSAVLLQLDELRTQPNPVADAANTEIARLRSLAEQEIADSNQLITRLRAQLGQDNSEEIAVTVNEQNQIIADARQELAAITDEKFRLETDLRMLEAEVGPIKYIAELIYDNTDKDMLEQAVRWVILIIIVVFDPLAVILLIASQYAYDIHKRNRTVSKVQTDINTNEILDMSDIDVFSPQAVKKHLVRLSKKVNKK